MGRDVGDLGEDVFRTLCSSSGVLCNKSERDRRGWDFFVQFSKEDESQAEDLVGDTDYSCFIQVKSTDQNSGKVPIFSARLYDLARVPNPAFIFVLEFGGKESPLAAYLMEVGDVLREKAIRAKMAKSKVKKSKRKAKDKFKPNKIALDYRNDALKLQDVTGLSLKKAIIAVVGKNPGDYVRKKLHHFENAGFPERRHEVSVTFGGGGNDAFYKSLVEMAFGDREFVDVEKAELSTIRFDQKIPFNKDIRGAKLTAKAPPLKAKMSIFDKKGRSSTIDCEIFHPWSVFPFIPKKYVRIRLVSEDLKIDFNFESNERIKLQTNWSKLSLGQLGILQKFIELSIHGGMAKMEITVQGKSAHAFEFQWPQIRFLENQEQILRIIPMLQKLIANYSLSSDEKISFEDLHKCKPNVEAIVTAINGEVSGKLQCVLAGSEASDGESVRVRMPIAVAFEENILAVAVDISGVARPESNGRREVTISAVEDVSSKMFLRSEGVSVHVKKWARQISENYSGSEKLFVP